MDLHSDAMDISDDDTPAGGRAPLRTTKKTHEPSNGHSNDPSDDNSDDNSGEDGPVFEVETILAQRKVSGSLEYLVKWDGYDVMNATWEPKKSFDVEQTLKDWQEKKRQIQCGDLPSFNIKKWEKDKSKLEDEFSAAGKDLEENNSELHTNMEDYFFPLLAPNPDPPRRSRHRLSTASDASSSLFVTPEPTSSRNQTLPTLPLSSLRRQPVATHPSIEDSESPVVETTTNEPNVERDANRDENPFKLPFPPQDPSASRLSVSSDAYSSLFVTPEPTSSNKQALPSQPLPSTSRAPVASRPPIGGPKPPDATSQEKRRQQPSNQAPISQGSKAPRPANQKAGSTTTSTGHKSTAPPAPTEKPSTQKPSTQKPSTQKPSTQKSAAHKPPVVVPSRVGFGQSARPRSGRKRGFESSWGRDRAPAPGEIQLMKPSEYSKRENYAHATPNVPASTVPSAAAQSLLESPGAAGAIDLMTTPGIPPAPDPSTIWVGQSGPTDSGPITGQSQHLLLGDAIEEESNTSTLPLLTNRRNNRSTGPHRSSHLPGFNRRPSSPDGDNRQGGNEHARRRSPGVYSRRFSGSGDAAPPVSPPPALSEEDQISSMPVGRPQEGATEWGHGLFNNPGEVFAHIYFGDLKTYIGPMRLVGQPIRAKSELLSSGVTVGSHLELWFKELYTLKEHTDLLNKGSPSRILCNAWIEGFESSNENLFRMAEYLRKERMAAVYRPANLFASNWIAYSPETGFGTMLNKGSQSQFPSNVRIHLAIRETIPPLSVLPGTREPRPPSDEFLYGNVSQFMPSGHKNRPEKTGNPLESNELPFQPDLNHSSPSDPQCFPDSSTRPSEIAMQPQTFSDMISKAFPTTHTRLLGELVCNFPKVDNQPLFYLHFPLGDEDVGGDFDFMATWLGCFNIKYLSNRDNNRNENNSGWLEFCNTHKSGVVVFHESFYDFAKMRPTIRHAHRNPEIDFWNVRLKRPLDFPDLRFAKEGCHIQRLFPHGSAILVTEDVCQDIKELAILVFWFYKKWNGRKGVELNKLVFWPNVLGYLDKRLEDPSRKKEDDPFILCIIAYIKYVNCDPDSASPHFDISSMDIRNFDSPNNNVVCLPIQDYGRRQEKENPHLPKGLTQAERDADHLVEAFSGWTLLNAACLRKTMVISNHKNERLLHHWASRGHVNVYECKVFFEKLGSDFKASALQALQNEPKRDGESSNYLGDRSATTPRPPQTPNTPLEPQNCDTTEHPMSGGDLRATRPSRWAPPAPHGIRHSTVHQ